MNFETRKGIALAIIETFHNKFDEKNDTALYDHTKSIYGRIAGNDNFRKILGDIPAFAADCKNISRGMEFVECPVITGAVCQLYEDNGRSADFDATAIKSLNACLRNWMGGMTRVRRPHLDKKKRCLWIDVFSALNHRYHCFSNETTEFSDFLPNYSKFISDIDNTSVVGISPRSLPDIAEAYCVFYGKTQFFFKELLQKLIEAKNDGEESSVPDYGQTRLIKTDIVNLISNSKGGDNEDLVKTICDYVTANSDRFDVMFHFCIIAETLGVLENECINFNYFDKGVWRLFTEMTVDYETKKKSLTKLKKSLFCSLFGNPDGNPPLSYASSLLCKNRYPGVEGHIYSVMGLLRFTIAVSVIENYISNNMNRKMLYRDSKETVIGSINDFLENMGLPGIGKGPSRTLGREIDDCIFKYLSDCPYLA